MLNSKYCYKDYISESFYVMNKLKIPSMISKYFDYVLNNYYYPMFMDIADEQATNLISTFYAYGNLIVREIQDPEDENEEIIPQK